jgi:hypothetical protein
MTLTSFTDLNMKTDDYSGNKKQVMMFKKKSAAEAWAM